MALLGPDDLLPHRQRRALVAGTSGSGKTTVAGLVAGVLCVPHVELDSLFHGPGWVPRAAFKQDVHRFSAGPEWVTEWQYGAVRPHLLSRADLVVWLDVPTHVTMRQLLRRTVSRRLRRDVLWNGNVEPPLWTVLTDPEHVVRWAWAHRGASTARVSGVVAERPGLPVVRLRSPAEITRWLTGPLREAAGRST